MTEVFETTIPSNAATMAGQHQAPTKRGSMITVLATEYHHSSDDPLPVASSGSGGSQLSQSSSEMGTSVESVWLSNAFASNHLRSGSTLSTLPHCFPSSTSSHSEPAERDIAVTTVSSSQRAATGKAAA
eukprot:CAMPEP_0204322252 /NCGR_PEP_ID=MMETSP0469-20131031/8589_1 /ASSEMBLY_ACC=CAM_ASM_000384 /TAXON_ID=2969 /ORGANISM="Oxyrrhis marina" /LENGTH=128 /DNA_ID=CAMNT_0051303589 /DNA_START=641 /DNA_END=1023 /DNA_ORIENTATION=+